MKAEEKPLYKFKTDTLYWLCDQNLPCQVPQWFEKIKLKISMATMNQINKAVRYFKFQTRNLEQANAEMLEKSIVVQN